MKLCLLLTVATLVAAAQPKKTTTIVVNNTLTAAENYTATGQLLAANGWGIAFGSAELGTLTTGPMPCNNGVVVTLKIATTANAVTISGTYTCNINATPMVVKNVGMAGSPAQIAWLAMHNAATLIGQNLVYY